MTIDKIGWNFQHSYRELPTDFHSYTEPDQIPEPKLVLLNKQLAKSLGLNSTLLETDVGVSTLAGNELPQNSYPISLAYAGHQFGHLTMLGDGRAILLGEHMTPNNECVDIQYKGSGPTRYSRGGDGKGALGPMLREYIISEAMYALRIPTTRSLAVVETGESVIRETKLRGAILIRVATSHIRVGTFQYARLLNDITRLKALADYTIKRHDPDIYQAKNRYVHFLERVVKRQAKLVAQWQLVGFVHGVMNTDNVTISGETIDYGPCAFINEFDRDTVFSSIDDFGRYKYGNQPAIANWNLARFAETLLPLIDSDEQEALKQAERIIHSFPHHFQSYWLDGMRKKLGLLQKQQEDEQLINELLQWMEDKRVDYTNTFLDLTFNRLEKPIYNSTTFKTWYEKWQRRLLKEERDRNNIKQTMKKHNPALIPRNHLVEEALQLATDKDDLHFLHKLLDALRYPYAHDELQRQLASIPIPDGPYQTFCGT